MRGEELSDMVCACALSTRARLGPKKRDASEALRGGAAGRTSPLLLLSSLGFIVPSLSVIVGLPASLNAFPFFARGSTTTNNNQNQQRSAKQNQQGSNNSS